MTVVAKAEMPDQDKTVKQMLHQIVAQNAEQVKWQQSITRRVEVLEATLPERHDLIQQPEAVVEAVTPKVETPPEKPKTAKQLYRQAKKLLKASGLVQQQYRHFEAYKAKHKLSKTVEINAYYKHYVKCYEENFVVA